MNKSNKEIYLHHTAQGPLVGQNIFEHQKKIYSKICTHKHNTLLCVKQKTLINIKPYCIVLACGSEKK